MNVLVACEESQEVCKAFRFRGHRAFSCDLLDCSGGHPEWHIQDDVLRIINGYKGPGFGCSCFTTNDGIIHSMPIRWDLIIAHPPCTYLTVSGNRWFNVDRYGEKALTRVLEREKAAEFFMRFINADCDLIAVENPIGYMNTHYRKPDQIIQPYQFGHSVRKSTCLWLKGLPKLIPTCIVDQGDIDEHGFTVGGPLQMVRGFNGKILRFNDPLTAKARSKTFPGIAAAFADQWGGADYVF